jgi:hypothetical protein
MASDLREDGLRRSQNDSFCHLMFGILVVTVEQIMRLVT